MMAVTINGDTGVDKVVDNTITTDDIQDGAITSAKIASGAIPNSYAGTKNLIINGDMRISQRGTSFTSNLENTYTLDRWRIHDRNCTSRSVTQETFAVGSVSTFGKEVQNYLRTTFSNDSGATPPYVMQAIEDVRSAAGETITLSFWAKADAEQDIALHYSQQFGGGGSGEVTNIIDTITIGTSWAKYTTTVAIPSVSGKTIGTSSNLRIDWRMPANTAITYDMTLVQLEIGDTATPFENLQYTTQLQLCQRYYHRINPDGTSGSIGSAAYYTSTTAFVSLNFPTSMRTSPSMEQVTGTDYYNINRNGANDTFNTFTLNTSNIDSADLYVASGVSGNTGWAGRCRFNSASGYVAFSAEV